MSTMFRCMAGLGLFSQLLSSQFAPAQEQQGKAASPADPAVTVEYPTEESGVFLENLGWVEITNDLPAKVTVKNAVAHALSAGAVPASAVAIYARAHAEVQIPPGRPPLCICQTPFGSTAPALVRLHPKKDSRELHGGTLPIIGASIVEVRANDLISVDLSHPGPAVWLVRPREVLPPGEYALMLDTEMMAIFPFTVTAPAKRSADSTRKTVVSMGGN